MMSKGTIIIDIGDHCLGKVLISDKYSAQNQGSHCYVWIRSEGLYHNVNIYGIDKVDELL
jgi:hypothetical protein